MTRQVLFIANTLDNAFKFQNVLAAFDVEVTAASTLHIERLLAPGSPADLVVFEAREASLAHMGRIVALAERRGCAFLAVTDEASVSELELPRTAASDFVMQGACREECAARVRRLLSKDGEGDVAKVICVESMTMNLDTYQVTIAGDPVDFTYLEYALLAYLVQHPNHTFSRDVLLQNVWGFESYCGSRTVDVHIRRIRAKLGPALAQHVETVRGVGYHWKTS